MGIYAMNLAQMRALVVSMTANGYPDETAIYIGMDDNGTNDPINDIVDVSFYEGTRAATGDDDGSAPFVVLSMEESGDVNQQIRTAAPVYSTLDGSKSTVFRG